MRKGAGLQGECGYEIKEWSWFPLLTCLSGKSASCQSSLCTEEEESLGKARPTAAYQGGATPSGYWTAPYN